jgi:nucleotide-binding universal stress UspA family protein
MYKSILVPLDASPFAEHALPVALSLARRSGARLMLVTVVTPLTQAYAEGLYVSTTDLEQEMNAQRRAYLAKTADRLRAKADISVLTLVEHGEVAPILSDLVSRGEADLIVMATHGRGAFARFWLGSVADEMLRDARVPLLLVRPNTGAADLDREPTLNKIILPLDGSDLAEQILKPIVTMAGLVPDSEVILVRAISETVPLEAAGEVPEAEHEARTLREEIRAIQTKLREEAHHYLESVAMRLRERGLKVTTQVVVEDRPAVAILDEAEARHAGMIALETHGRRGLARLALGSVADKVVRGSHIPVLVQRPMPA